MHYRAVCRRIHIHARQECDKLIARDAHVFKAQFFRIYIFGVYGRGKQISNAVAGACKPGSDAGKEILEEACCENLRGGSGACSGGGDSLEIEVELLYREYHRRGKPLIVEREVSAAAVFHQIGKYFLHLLRDKAELCCGAGAIFLHPLTPVERDGVERIYSRKPVLPGERRDAGLEAQVGGGAVGRRSSIADGAVGDRAGNKEIFVVFYYHRGAGSYCAVGGGKKLYFRAERCGSMRLSGLRLDKGYFGARRRQVGVVGGEDNTPY